MCLLLLHLCFEIEGEKRRFCFRDHMEGMDEDGHTTASLPTTPSNRASYSVVCWDRGTSNPSVLQYNNVLRSEVYGGKTGFSQWIWGDLGSVDPQNCAGAFFSLSNALSKTSL